MTICHVWHTHIVFVLFTSPCFVVKRRKGGAPSFLGKRSPRLRNEDTAKNTSGSESEDDFLNFKSRKYTHKDNSKQGEINGSEDEQIRTNDKKSKPRKSTSRDESPLSEQAADDAKQGQSDGSDDEQTNHSGIVNEVTSDEDSVSDFVIAANVGT